MLSLQTQAENIAATYTPPATGRPSDIGDATLLKELFAAIEDGNYMETACHLVGLSPVSVMNWKKRGEAGEAPFDRFVMAIKAAESRAEAKMVANVRRASELPQFWAAAATHLERRHPDRWGKRQDDSNTPKVVVNIGVGGSDVRIGILSPANVNELACGNPSQVEMLSPINRDYVNHAGEAIEAVHAEAIGDSLRSNPEGGPTRVPAAVTSALGVSGQRRGAGKKKGRG